MTVWSKNQHGMSGAAEELFGVVRGVMVRGVLSVPSVQALLYSQKSLLFNNLGIIQLYNVAERRARGG